MARGWEGDGEMEDKGCRRARMGGKRGKMRGPEGRREPLPKEPDTAAGCGQAAGPEVKGLPGEGQEARPAVSPLSLAHTAQPTYDGGTGVTQDTRTIT